MEQWGPGEGVAPPSLWGRSEYLGEGRSPLWPICSLVWLSVSLCNRQQRWVLLGCNSVQQSLSIPLVKATMCWGVRG